MGINIKGKKILITGASRGLGRELALQCARQGGRVVAVARTEDELESLKKEVDAMPGSPMFEFHSCDLADSKKMADILTRVAPVDIAIFNAGIKHTDGGFFSSGRIIETMEINLLSVIRGLDCILPSMIERNSGHLVFISSLGGYHGMLRANGYNASKAALSILADSIRMDLLSLGKKIVVTVVKPGPIQTGMFSGGAPRGLSVSKEKAAQIILEGIGKNKKEISFPKRMHILSIIVSLLPKSLEWRLFKRVKP